MKHIKLIILTALFLFTGIIIAFADNSSSSTSNNPSNCVNSTTKYSVDAGAAWIIASPFIIFLFSFIAIAIVLKRSKSFSLAYMLSEKDATGQAKTTSVTQADGTSSNQPTNSTSRFIIFLSGLSAIIISVCMVSYYMYFYLRSGCPPQFDSLLQPILALGIGVIPYSINKITSK